MAPKYRWDERGEMRGVTIEWAGEVRERVREQEKKLPSGLGISDEVRTRSLRHRRGGTILPAYKLQGWMRETEREREEFWEKLKRWGRREREGFWIFFVLASSFHERVLKFFKGKFVFLTSGELSIFETVGLNGRLRSIELQPCN